MSKFIPSVEKAKKRGSFSDLLKRLVNLANGQKLEKFYGVWDIDEEEFEKIEEQIRKNTTFSLEQVDLD